MINKFLARWGVRNDLTPLGGFWEEEWATSNMSLDSKRWTVGLWTATEVREGMTTY